MAYKIGHTKFDYLSKKIFSHKFLFLCCMAMKFSVCSQFIWLCNISYSIRVTEWKYSIPIMQKVYSVHTHIVFASTVTFCLYFTRYILSLLYTLHSTHGKLENFWDQASIVYPHVVYVPNQHTSHMCMLGCIHVCDFSTYIDATKAM